jgi:branched-chain amino acid transport system permease protein
MNNYLYNLFVNYLLFLAPLGFWICFGWSKILNLNQIVCFGLGGYTYAILTTKLGTNIYLALLGSIIIAILSNLLINAVLRYRPRINITIFSFVVVLFFHSLVINLNSVTNGPIGISQIPSFGNYFIIILVIWVLFVIITLFLFTKSRLGIIAKIMDKPHKFNNLIIDSKYSLVSVLSLAGLISGTAGVLSASYITYIDPSSIHYNFLVMILITSTLLKDNFWNIFWVSPFVVLLPEVLRYIEIESNLIFVLRNIIFDIILIFLFFVNQSKYASTN